MSSSSPAIRRIMREVKDWEENPSDVITAAPVEDNLFEWHFTICGSKDTEFEGGRYHGKFILPSQYPFKAPDVIMMNKSGRFEVGKKICLSFSGYHHELWQPAWTIRSMLTALRAFMESKAEGIGAMSVSKAQRRKYAKMSNHFTCSKCGVKMMDIVFPGLDSNCMEVPALKEKDTNTAVEMEKGVRKEKEENNDHDVNDGDDANEENVDDVEVENENGNESDGNGNNNTEPERAANVEHAHRGNENEAENPMIAERSPRGNANANGQDTMILDSFTILLVVMILGILVKKFAVTVLHELD